MHMLGLPLNKVRREHTAPSFAPKLEPIISYVELESAVQCQESSVGHTCLAKRRGCAPLAFICQLN